MLSRCQLLVDTLNYTNSSNEKVKILSEFSDLKPLISTVYDPLLPFHVTSKTIENTQTSTKGKVAKNVIDLIYMLGNRDITGHEAIATVKRFMSKNKQYTQLILDIIDKDLKIGMGVTQINKAFPGLIREFKTSLGEVLNEKTIKLLEKGTWYMSRKLDGVRCISTIGKHDVKYYSRTGNEFLTLDKLTPSLLAMFKDGDIVDGEVCLFNGSTESFQGIMKEIRKKNHTISNPRYNVFDCLTQKEFYSKTSTRTFKERYTHLNECVKTDSFIEVVDQKEYTPEEFPVMVAMADRKGWEGLMLRKNVQYEGKRSKNLLKVKKFDRIELCVESIITGPIRFRNESTGLVETNTTLAAVVVPYEGNKVQVGSGFSMEERKEMFKNPDLIVGKVISVQYFEKTTDRNGNKSLRFPTFKGVYGESRDY